MATKTHGLAIGIGRVKTGFYLTLRAHGTLTHEDYEMVSPLIDGAMQGMEGPCMRVLFDATELVGWTPQAAWDDFKIDLKHGKQFERIAMIGGKDWQEAASRVVGWFAAGELKHFDNEDKALEWLES